MAVGVGAPGLTGAVGVGVGVGVHCPRSTVHGWEKMESAAKMTNPVW